MDHKRELSQSRKIQLPEIAKVYLHAFIALAILFSQTYPTKSGENKPNLDKSASYPVLPVEIPTPSLVDLANQNIVIQPEATAYPPITVKAVPVQIP